MSILLLLFLLVLIKNRKITKFTEYKPQPFSKRELIRKITFSAIFIALGAVLKTVSISTGEMRLGFYEVPVFLSGMLLGPFFGALVGLGADMIYSISSGYSFSVIMMCSALMWGLLGGLFFQKKTKIWMIFSVCLIASVLATSINSVQLYIYYGMGMFGNLPNRIITMLVKWPLLSILIWLLYERVINAILKKITKMSTKK